MNMAENTTKSHKILRVRVVFPNTRSLPELTQLGPLHWGGRGPRLQQDGRMIGEVFVTPQQLEALTKIEGCETQVIEDATEVGKKRQREVGKGDRFEGGEKVPRGLGKKE
jgi:hypothetical protein